MARATTVKIMQEVNKHQVKQLLNWNDLEYGQFQMDTGIEYLKKMMDQDEFGINYLSQNSMFWRWWLNHWDKRDEQFISQASSLSNCQRLELYQAIHNARGFQFYPHKSIIEQTKKEAKGVAA